MASSLVLVLDNELGFVLALSQNLLSRNVAVLPARNTREARLMLRRFERHPDALVMNCSIAGACTLAKEINDAQPDVQVIGIISDNNVCRNCADLLQARFHDPEDRKPRQIPTCANVIEALLTKQRHRTGRTGGPS